MRIQTVVAMCLMAIAGCTALGLTQPSLDQKILIADQAVTAILTSTDTALNAHVITPDQAKSVSTIAHQVDPLLDAARAANAAGNAAGANSTLNLVNALIAGLQTFTKAQ